MHHCKNKTSRVTNTSTTSNCTAAVCNVLVSKGRACPQTNKPETINAYATIAEIPSQGQDKPSSANADPTPVARVRRQTLRRSCGVKVASPIRNKMRPFMTTANVASVLASWNQPDPASADPAEPKRGDGR